MNNAALNYYLPTETYPTNRWIRCFAVNVHGPFMLAKEVLKDMVPRRSGAIVNISSGAAIGPGAAVRGPDGARGRDVRRDQGGAGTVHAGSGAGTRAVRRDHVAAVSPSKVVPTPGTVYHKLVSGIDDPKGENPSFMARAALLLASEGADKVNGRVTYSQQILKEFGWITEGVGRGVDTRGSGYSEV